MLSIKKFISILAVFILSGCATKIPFNTASIGGESTVTSSKTASILRVSGAIRGGQSTTLIPVGTILVPIASGPNPELQFHNQDQAEFTEVLRTELLRLKVFQSISAGENQDNPDIKITIVFAQTYHMPQMQEYILDVAMNIEGGKRPLLKQYRVGSHEKSSLWEKLNTNAYEGKVLAVRRLLEKLIPDIQSYIAENV